MKVLLISISAPPQNTPESLQVIKYANHLASRCELTVLTIKKARGWRKPDRSLSDAIRPARFIRMPHYSSKAGRFLSGILNKNWLLKPDEDFMFPLQWKRAVKKIGHKPDILYSRSTPYSSALMGLKLKQHYRIPWVLHLSDPWLLSPLNSFTGKLRDYHSRTEQQCFENADVITLTSHEQLALYQEHYPQLAHKFQFYPNVYNDDEVTENPLNFNGKMVFLHTGNFYGEGRNPVFLLEAIRKIIQRGTSVIRDCEFVFIGRLNADVRDVFNRYQYPFVKVIEDYTFNDVVQYQRNAHVLLLFDWKFKQANSVFFLSKILAYMTAQRPILAVTGLNSTCRSVIEGKYGGCFEHDDTDGIAAYLIDAINNFNAKNSSFFRVASPDPAYSARYNAERLYSLFESLM
ncbi:MAG: glycosyltransferase [Cyclobacteriaceae bacterium]